jgi:hypothetical protein
MFALSNYFESCFFECLNSPEMINTGDFGHR